MNTFQRRQRLLDWLGTIRAEVQNLILDQHLFWEIQAIIGGNPKFGDASGIFNQWMKSSFVQATAIGVRRQVKSGDHSISLRRLLQEVLANPSLVSRQHYLSLFADEPDWLKEVGDEEFDSIAGKGAAELPTTCVDKQIRRLEAAAGTIEHYVDRRIAHDDSRGLAKPEPRWRDLEDALKVLEDLVLFYSRLLKGSAPMLPMLPPEWKGVFTFPWIERGANGESVERNPENRDATLVPGGTSMKTRVPVIHRDPDILGGIPVFIGTRVPLRNLIDYLERDHSLDEFLDAFPSVSREQAVAALEAAHEALTARAHSAR